MNKILKLDSLTKNEVSVVYTGENYRSYINSENGRKQVQEEVAEPYKSAIMAIWGDNATVIEESPPSATQ